MFGSEVWKNVVLEVTFWHFDDHSAKIRNQTVPMLTEDLWTTVYNQEIRTKYKLKFDLPVVFIDSHFDKTDLTEKQPFKDNAQEVLSFAKSKSVYMTKNMNNALSTREQLVSEIRRLEVVNNERAQLIKMLEIGNFKLEQDLQNFNNSNHNCTIIKIPQKCSFTIVHYAAFATFALLILIGFLLYRKKMRTDVPSDETSEDTLN